MTATVRDAGSIHRLALAIAFAVAMPMALAAQTPKPAEQSTQSAQPPTAGTEFIVPPPRGTPRELATGATRGVKPTGVPAARPFADTPAAPSR